MCFVSRSEREVVAQIIKTEFIVGRVSDVALIRRLLFFASLAAFRNANRQAQKFVNRSHPVGIALREVLVDSDNVHAVTADRIQVCRQRRHKCLALTGAHLGDIAIMQHHGTDQLYVERSQLHGAHGRFTSNGECFR